MGCSFQPKFTEYTIHGTDLMNKVRDLGLFPLTGPLDATYYYTDLNGWQSILKNMTTSSLSYKKDKFDCENYALKAMIVAAEKYGLNTMGFVLGYMPQGYHGWNVFYHGAGFMYFEPNSGFANHGAFPIGQNGYEGKFVLL